jgi:NAD(P)-dependent dehydrogenase (short-subunit alcohol dehydrogenase family)
VEDSFLRGKTAIVTGAAGNIGSAFVDRLDAAGARVIAVDISGERLDQLAAGRDLITTVVADVGLRDGADRAVAACEGSADILCNIAGIGDGLFGADEMSDDLWDRVIEVNLTGTFRLTRRVLPLMLARGGGTVINLSSVAGLRGGRAGIGYTASKWAMIGMTQNIAANLGPEGIRCFAICPGGIQGAVTAAGIQYSELGRQRAQARMSPASAPRGEASDVAALGMFLLSEQSHHLNGVAIPLDAGVLAG